NPAPTPTSSNPRATSTSSASEKKKGSGGQVSFSTDRFPSVVARAHVVPTPRPRLWLCASPKEDPHPVHPPHATPQGAEFGFALWTIDIGRPFRRNRRRPVAQPRHLRLMFPVPQT